jgi:predicted site-specific integrase-resolvase
VIYQAFYTLNQVSDILNVTWQTIRNYIKNGDLKAIKLIMIEVIELIQLIYMISLNQNINMIILI